MRLPRALELGELREDERDSLLHALVRVLLNAIAPDFYIACRNTKNERAAARFLLQRLLRALAEQRQFKLAHRPLHAEQQPIIGMARIINSIFVDDNGPDQSTKLDQSVPVRAVARETQASIAKTAPTWPLQIAANSRSKPGRAMPPPDRPRSSSMISTVAPAKLFGAIGKPILPPLTFKIVHELIRG